VTGSVILHPVPPHQPAVLLTEIRPTETTKTSRACRHQDVADLIGIGAGEPEPHSVASRADAAPNSIANAEPPARSSERPYRFAVSVYLIGWRQASDGGRRGTAALLQPGYPIRI